MVVVPAGEFVMGSPPTEKRRMPDEVPQHTVTIARPFAVSKYDVTFNDWDACVSVGGCPREGRAGDVDWGRDTRPVIYVSWDDAQQYVAWLSLMTGKPYRLLSDAEFEYAARAGTQTAYPWGDDIDASRCNFLTDPSAKRHRGNPVMSAPANGRPTSALKPKPKNIRVRPLAS